MSRSSMPITRTTSGLRPLGRMGNGLPGAIGTADLSINEGFVYRTIDIGEAPSEVFFLFTELEIPDSAEIDATAGHFRN